MAFAKKLPSDNISEIFDYVRQYRSSIQSIEREVLFDQRKLDMLDDLRDQILDQLWQLRSKHIVEVYLKLKLWDWLTIEEYAHHSQAQIDKMEESGDQLIDSAYQDLTSLMAIHTREGGQVTAARAVQGVPAFARKRRNVTGVVEGVADLDIETMSTQEFSDALMDLTDRIPKRNVGRLFQYVREYRSIFMALKDSSKSHLKSLPQVHLTRRQILAEICATQADSLQEIQYKLSIWRWSSFRQDGDLSDFEGSRMLIRSAMIDLEALMIVAEQEALAEQSVTPPPSPGEARNSVAH